ncbi:MAG: nitroreductase family protein [Crenarchaeota archaeon]|nr:nitroreductase family protein [Thermoproteota archaeon]MDW8034163.1 nitroreductase family protein [Nitrososphaerota archaeon]
MKVREAIERRRAYRAIEPIEVTDELIKDLAYHASLAPSCYNNQPWRFVFVKNREKIGELYDALSSGNSWAKKSSLIIAVYSEKDYDCIIGEREYYLFDTGMAVAFMILRATELDLVAHPIAGYDSEMVKRILEIPENAILITLIVVGKHSDEAVSKLPTRQREVELKRPPRKSFEEFAKVV